MSIIEMNYNAACKQAKKLEDTADTMNAVVYTGFTGTIDQLTAGWKGESADLYRVKADELSQNIEVAVKELRQIAAAIREIAQRIYEADQRAAEIAANKSAAANTAEEKAEAYSAGGGGRSSGGGGKGSFGGGSR